METCRNRDKELYDNTTEQAYLPQEFTSTGRFGTSTDGVAYFARSNCKTGYMLERLASSKEEVSDNQQGSPLYISSIAKIVWKT
jgi:hypothetical protein